MSDEQPKNEEQKKPVVIIGSLWGRQPTPPTPEQQEAAQLREQIKTLVDSMKGATDSKLQAEKEALLAKIKELETQPAATAPPTQQEGQQTAPTQQEQAPKRVSVWSQEGLPKGYRGLGRRR